MSIAEKLTTVAENQQKVFDAGKEAGKEAEWKAFWGDLLINGTRTNYNYAFYLPHWVGVLRNHPPAYDMKPTTATYMFQGWNTSSKTFDLVALLEEWGITLDFSNCTNFNRIFESNTTNSHVGVMDIRKGTNFTSAFAYSKIETIDKVIVDENLNFSAIFTSYSALKNITFEGNIGKALNMSACKVLTSASVQSVIDHLKDLTGATTQTLTLHATVGAALTDVQKAAISAKNWTLAY